jgi:hypothetical protein
MVSPAFLLNFGNRPLTHPGRLFTVSSSELSRPDSEATFASSQSLGQPLEASIIYRHNGTFWAIVIPRHNSA